MTNPKNILALLNTGVRRTMSALLATLLMLSVVPYFLATPASAATRTFTTRFTQNALGDIVFVANTLMTCSGATCTAAQGGAASTLNLNNNNGQTMVYVDQDGAAPSALAAGGTRSTFSSSYADMKLPVGASVLFAGLYWGGNSSSADRDKALFSYPGSNGYVALTASQLDFGASDYQAYIDVTSYVQGGLATTGSGNVGTYAVADVQSTPNATNQYAGWSLVVAYGDPNGTFRNLTVFDGYQSVGSNNPQTIPVTGFLTPPSGDVKTKLGVVAYEGDLGNVGDALSLNGTVMTDAVNPPNNFFNSSIANSGAHLTTKSPNYLNQLGYDADIISVPNTGNAIIANSATSATINLTSAGDVYYPGVVTFVTDLYAPKMKVDKQASDVNGGVTIPGDEIEYTLTVTNSGDDSSVNNILTDTIPNHMSYVPGSMKIVTGPNAGDKTDATADDEAYFSGTAVVFNLGLNATPTAGGELVKMSTPGSPTTTVVKFRTKVLPTAPDGVPIANSASLTYTAFTLASASTTSGTVNTTGSGPVQNVADLSIVKTNTTGETVPGQNVTYDIVVSNTATGSGPVAGATIVDTLPATLSGATWTCVATAGSSCTTASGSGNINTTANLAVGGVVTYTVTALLNASATGNLVNTATVTVPTGVTDPTAANNSSTSTVAMTPKADLGITKTDGASQIAPGQPITYTVVASNAGPSTVTGAIVADTPPLASGAITWTCVGGSGGTCPASGTGNLNTAVSLPVNGTATFTVTYTVDAAATSAKLDNTATITAPASVADANTTNNSALDSNDLVRNADLSITKSHPAGPVVPGTNVTYTIDVTNAGPSVASTASVTDTLPSGMTFVSVSSATWTCPASPTGSQAVCTRTNVPVGTSTITVVAAVDPTLTGSPANSATVSSPDDSTTGNNSASDVTSLTPNANLSIAKSHAPNPVIAGTNVTYTISVTNPGPSSAADVVVTDTLPSGLTRVSATAPSGWTCSGATCSTPSMTTGSATITIVATLDAGFNAATITNNVSVASPTDTTTGNNSATDVADTAKTADLRVAKSHAGTIVAGSPAVYTIVASNNGPSHVTGAIVNDPLPAQLSTASWTCTATAGSSCPASGSGTVSNVAVNLLSGGTATFTLTATVSSTATADFDNIATIAAPAGVTESTPGNNSSTDRSTPSLAANLAIAKTNNATSSTPGSNTTYTITASNAGPSFVTGATVTDTVPASLLNATWSCVATGSGSSCPASGTGNINASVNLAAGGNATFTLTALIDSAAVGQLDNTATITAPATVTDTTPNNNSAIDSDTLQAIADVSIAKTDNAGTRVPGTSTSYTITVTNNGPSTAAGVTVNDTLPAALQNATWTCAAAGAGSSCPSSGAGNIATPVTLGASGTATFTVTATISPTATGDLINDATLTIPATLTDPNPNNNSASDTSTLTPRANVSLTKTDGSATAIPGATVSYTITASNAGPSAAPGVRIVDNVPTSLQGASWTCVASGGATCPAASGTGNIDTSIDLAVNATVTYTLTGTIDAAATGTIANSATATLPATVVDPDPSDNNPTDTDTLVPTAEIGITKRNTTGATVIAGTSVTYEVKVTNSGPSVANGVTVSDPLPASITNATWTCVASSGSSCGALSGNGSILSTVNLLPAGEATFTINATVAAAASGNVANTATVTYPATITDPTPGPTTATDTATVGKAANLKVTKTDGSTTATPGGATTYTVVVSNDGPSDVTGATIVDTLPSALLNATWSCVASSGSLCSAGGGVGSINTTANLVSGGNVTYTILADINPAARGTLANTASVAAPLGVVDTNPSDSSATDSSTLVPVANLSITKTDGTGAAIAGTTATYTIVVRNSGPSFVAGASVVDLVGTKLINPTWSCVTAPVNPQNSCPSTGSGDINALVDLAPFATATFTLRGPINPAFVGTLINTATVTNPAGIGDPDTADNSATDQTAVTATANLAITKTDGATASVPGATISYTIAASNSGPSNAPGVRVVDSLPASLINATWTCTGPCPASGSGNINETLNLNANETATFTVNATIDPTATGQLTNNASLIVPPSVVDPSPSDNTPSDTNTLVPTAELRITKINTTGASVAAGTPVTYVVTVHNDGPSAATGVAVTDNLPATLLNPSWSCSATAGSTCASASGTGSSLPLVDIAAGGDATLRIATTLSPDASGTLTNTAVVTYPTGLTDPTPGPTEATDTATIERVANLRIAKTNNAASSTPGTNATYIITVTNDGPSNVVGARIVDNIPAALQNASWTCAASSGSHCNDPSGNGSINTTADIVSGGTVTYTLVAEVDQNSRVNLDNTATVTAPSGVRDPNPNDSSATDSDALTPSADLAITKSDGRTDGIAGTSSTYTIVVTNNGPSGVSGARVRDLIGTNLVGATWNCATSPATSANSCSIANGTGDVDVLVNLNRGASATINLSATVAASFVGTLTNTATVTPPSGVVDSDPTNNSRDDTTQITAEADLRVTKTNGATTVVPGAAIVYTVTAANAGPSDAPGVFVQDNFPAAFTNVSWTCSGACPQTSGTGNLAQTIDLAANTSAVYTLRATLDSAAIGTISNTATATLPPSIVDPDPSNGTATDRDTATPTADIIVTKTNNLAGSLVAGEAVTYTITVTNAGPSKARGLTVTDNIPAAILNAAWQCAASAGATCPTTAGTGSLSEVVDLDARATLTYTVTGMVARSARGSIANTASVTYPTGLIDPTPGPTEATDTAVVLQKADLTITKTDNATEATPGTPISYIITVANAGPADVTGAIVDDKLPRTLINAAWTCSSTIGSVCNAANGTGNIATTVDLLAGGSATYVLAADIDPTAPAGPLNNTAKIVAPSGVIDTTLANSSASDINVLKPSTDLVLTKTDSKGSALAGSANEYIITVTNKGPSFANGARVRDLLTNKLTKPTWTCTVTAGPGNRCTNVVGTGDVDSHLDLGVNATATITVKGTIVASLRGDLDNTANVDVAADALDPNLTDNGATDRTALNAEADVSITKTNNEPGVVPGAVTTYDIVVANAGPSTATNVTVSDPMLAPFTSFEWTCFSTTTTCPTPAGSGSIAQTNITLDPDTQLTYTVRAKTAPEARGTTTNVATVSALETDPTRTNNTARVVKALTPKANLKVTKTNNTAALTPGLDAGYTITVTNEGPSSVIGATLTDIMPSDLTDVTWTCTATSATCGATSGTGNVDMKINVSVDGKVVVVVLSKSKPSARGTLTNTAKVTVPADFEDLDPSDNDGVDSDPLTPRADLKIEKSDGAENIVPGDKTRYTIKVTNLGPSDATDATMTDVVPEGLTDLVWTCESNGIGSCTPPLNAPVSGTNAFVGRAIIPVGASVNFFLDAVVDPDASGAITNTARVASAGDVVDTVTSNNDSTDTSKFTPRADLTLTKTDETDVATAGKKLTYKIDLRNDGPSSTGATQVVDKLPAALIDATWTCAIEGKGSCLAATGSGSIDTTVKLAPKSQAHFVLKATVDPNTDETELVNTATATLVAAPATGSTGTASATDTDKVNAETDVAITKTHAGELVAGAKTVYTIAVSNKGPSNAKGVTIDDTLPASLTDATWVCAGTAGSTCATPSGSGNVSLKADVKAGGTVTVTLTATVDSDADDQLANTATVAVKEGTVDISGDNNSATDTATVTRVADVSVTKTDGRAYAVQGRENLYAIVVTNAGPSGVRNVLVNDRVPMVLSNVSWTCELTSGKGACSAPSGEGDIADVAVDLSKNSSATFYLIGTLSKTALAPLVNTATVTSPSNVNDKNSANNSATDRDVIWKEWLKNPPKAKLPKPKAPKNIEAPATFSAEKPDSIPNIAGEIINTLALTGAQSQSLGAIALLLILGGLVLVVATRRRKRIGIGRGPVTTKSTVFGRLDKATPRTSESLMSKLKKRHPQDRTERPAKRVMRH